MTTFTRTRLRDRVGRFTARRRSEPHLTLTPASPAHHEAADHRTLPERLHELSFNDDPQIRAAIAGNPSTPARVATRLTDDPVVDVRVASAAHPHVPAARLRLMLRDPDDRVRQAASDALSMRREPLETNGFEFATDTY